MENITLKDILSHMVISDDDVKDYKCKIVVTDGAKDCEEIDEFYISNKDKLKEYENAILGVIFTPQKDCREDMTLVVTINYR